MSEGLAFQASSLVSVTVNNDYLASLLRKVFNQLTTQTERINQLEKNIDAREEKIRQFTSQAYLDKTKLTEQDGVIKKLADRLEAMESKSANDNRAIQDVANRLSSLEHRLESLEKWRLDNDISKQMEKIAQLQSWVATTTRSLAGRLLTDAEA